MDYSTNSIVNIILKDGYVVHVWPFLSYNFFVFRNLFAANKETNEVNFLDLTKEAVISLFNYLDSNLYNIPNTCEGWILLLEAALRFEMIDVRYRQLIDDAQFFNSEHKIRRDVDYYREVRNLAQTQDYETLIERIIHDFRLYYGESLVESN